MLGVHCGRQAYKSTSTVSGVSCPLEVRVELPGYLSIHLSQPPCGLSLDPLMTCNCSTLEIYKSYTSSWSRTDVLQKRFCFVLAGSIVKMYFVIVAWSCLSLCNPMDCSSPGSSVHGILQARILEWVAMPSSRESSWPRDWIRVSCIGRQILYYWATWEAQGVLYIPWNLPILSVQVNDFWYIYRVVQLLPQSNFRTFPSSPKGTSCLFAVTFNFYSSPGQPPFCFL